MKSKKVLSFVAALVMAMTSVGSLVGCANISRPNVGGPGYYAVVVDPDMPTVIKVGDTVDFKQYFVVLDQNGNQIMVTDAMIDASKADTSQAGQFTVTLNIGDTSESLTFTVKNGDGNGGNGGNGGDDIGNGETVDLGAVLAQYSDNSKWNFATDVTISNSSESSDDYYEYRGYNVLNTYEYDGDTYTDYLGYDVSAGAYTFYYDNGDGTYDELGESDSDFEECVSYMNLVFLTEIGNYEFVAENGGYVAKKPNDAGNNILCEYDDSTWTSFRLTVTNGKISQILATTSDGYTFKYVFSKYGSITFTLPGSGSGTTTPVQPTGVMSKQTYNAATFDDRRLHEKMMAVTGDYADPAIGLPSTGTYSALVIPVKIDNYDITSTQLANLDKAFNGTAQDTGWESVNSYYKKSSYGALDISFDIVGYGDMSGLGLYTAQNSLSYYEKHTATEDGYTYNDGDNLILHEALKHYDSQIDYSKYDTNNDGYLDAVYIIYSAPVDYDDGDFWWAYVTWNYEENKYDGKNVYYYMFTGIDFMKESVQGGYTNEYYPAISGLKINAATYIHESGHLLGLDDYYDYEESKGSNEGLGGADMMDATVGDQNVYSKTMLGWLTPQIVTTTKTITIKSSQERGDAILIPLDFDNSFFCEYLLIDLYSAQGLNALHANMSGSYLYDGASYGVRIYHVTSWAKNPYDNDFGSFTDNNNSSSTYSLIKLVEADGDKKFSSDSGYAAADDLWQKGDKLSTVFPKYTTNAGKTLIFDISIDNVSASEATITITYTA